MSYRRSFLPALPYKSRPKLRGLRAVQRRARLVMIASIAFGAILLAVGAWRAVKTFDSVKNEESLRAEAVASRVADRLAAALNDRFADLRFLGHALLGQQTARATLDPSVKSALRAFLATQPTLRDINVLNAEGDRILWSARKQSSQPILSAL